MILRVTCRYCLGGSVSRKRTDAFDKLSGSTVRRRPGSRKRPDLRRCPRRVHPAGAERLFGAQEPLRLGRPRELAPEGVVGALQELVLLEGESTATGRPFFSTATGSTATRARYWPNRFLISVAETVFTATPGVAGSPILAITSIPVNELQTRVAPALLPRPSLVGGVRRATLEAHGASHKTRRVARRSHLRPS